MQLLISFLKDPKRGYAVMQTDFEFASLQRFQGILRTLNFGLDYVSQHSKMEEATIGRENPMLWPEIIRDTLWTVQ